MVLCRGGHGGCPVLWGLTMSPAKITAEIKRIEREIGVRRQAMDEAFKAFWDTHCFDARQRILDRHTSLLEQVVDLTAEIENLHALPAAPDKVLN